MVKFANANIANNINMKFDGTYGEKWCECPYVGKWAWSPHGSEGSGPSKVNQKVVPSGLNFWVDCYF